MSQPRPAASDHSSSSLAIHLRHHTGIHLHHGPDQASPHWRTTVWAGDLSLPPTHRGLRVLGLPLGRGEYIRAELAALHTKQQPLLEAIPTLPDLQTSWLMLLCCAPPRPHYALRGLRPDLMRDFAIAHDQSIHQCLAQLLQIPKPTLPETSANRARLVLNHGGLGLRRAFLHTAATFWASWQDAASTIHSKTPDLFQQVACCFQAPQPDPPPSSAFHTSKPSSTTGPERSSPPIPSQQPATSSFRGN